MIQVGSTDLGWINGLIQKKAASYKHRKMAQSNPKLQKPIYILILHVSITHLPSFTVDVKCQAKRERDKKTNKSQALSPSFSLDCICISHIIRSLFPPQHFIPVLLWNGFFPQMKKNSHPKPQSQKIDNFHDYSRPFLVYEHTHTNHSRLCQWFPPVWSAV